MTNKNIPTEKNNCRKASTNGIDSMSPKRRKKKSGLENNRDKILQKN